MNIELNKKYKYKKLCSLMGQTTRTGRSKQLQLKDWHRFFDWENPTTQTYLITEIYETPLEKINNRGGVRKGAGRKPKDLEFCEVYKVGKQYDDSKGVYKIQLNNSVYIGSTIAGFRHRFMQHYNGNYCGQMLYTQQLLLNGGTFESIWIAGDSDDIETIRDKEKYYIQKYYNNGFDMVNKKMKKRKNKKNTKDYRVKNIEDMYIVIDCNGEVVKEFTVSEWLKLIV